MSLITKILQPDQFNAQTIADLMWSGIGGEAMPPDLKANIEAAARYVLNSLEARGIVNRTAILKPADFNSTTIAILMWEQGGGPNAWSQGTKDARQITIDQAQYVLDALAERGIIG